MGLYTKNNNPHNGKIVKQTTDFMEAFNRYQKSIPRNVFKILDSSCLVEDLVWSWIGGEYKWDNGRRGSASVDKHHVVVTVFGSAELGGVFGAHLIVKIDDVVIVDLEPFSQFRSYTSDILAKNIKMAISLLEADAKAKTTPVMGDDLMFTYPTECHCNIKGKARRILTQDEINAELKRLFEEYPTLEWLIHHMPED